MSGNKQDSGKKSVIGIALITGVAVLGDAMLFIVLPIFWKDFGLTAIWQVGLLLSVNRLIRLPINPLVGLFYRHFQLRTGVLIGVVLAVVTTASYGIIQHFWLLLIMRALWGVAWSLLRLGGFLTVIDVSTDKNRGQFVGMYNGLWGLGGLVGMLAGGILVDQTSIISVTSMFALIGLLAFPATWIFVPVKKGEEAEYKKHNVFSGKWLTPYVGLVLTTGVSMGFIVFGLFASTLSPLIEKAYVNEWSIAQFTIGAATLAGIVQAVRWGWDPLIAPLIGKRLDSNRSMHKTILVPLFGGGILIILLGFIPSIMLLIIVLLLFQLASTIFVTTTDTLATKAATLTDRVKVMTAHTVVVDVGASIGPLAAFLLMEQYSISIVYTVAGILLIILGAVWLGFNNRTILMNRDAIAASPCSTTLERTTNTIKQKN